MHCCHLCSLIQEKKNSGTTIGRVRVACSIQFTRSQYYELQKSWKTQSFCFDPVNHVISSWTIKDSTRIICRQINLLNQELCLSSIKYYQPLQETRTNVLKAYGCPCQNRYRVSNEHVYPENYKKNRYSKYHMPLTYCKLLTQTSKQQGSLLF